MKTAETLGALSLYIYIYIYISILLEKKENTRENSLGEIGFVFVAIKKKNINRKEVGYSCI